MDLKTTQKSDRDQIHFGTAFCPHFGTILAPTRHPKLNQNLNQNLDAFSFDFWTIFEPFLELQNAPPNLSAEFFFQLFFRPVVFTVPRTFQGAKMYDFRSQNQPPKHPK